MRIYLDHNATTTPRPEVAAALGDAAALANPSSLHAEGRAARQAVEVARRQVAALLCARPEEIVFTSGGTESNNAAILGAARAARRAGRPPRLVAGPIEHPSVDAPLALLAEEGFALVRLSASPGGQIDPEAARAALAPGAALLSLQLVNHEIGTLNPVADLAPLCRAAGALLHCDAVQAAGRLPVDVQALGVDLLSVSAHKLRGPRGAGALYVRRGADVAPLLVGGAQERGRRAGTENVPAIVGFGLACALAAEGLADRARRVAALRDRLEAALLAIPGARTNGAGPRAPGTCNVAFDGVEGELLFMNLDLLGVACSTGAACSSGSPEPSKVLLGLGQPAQRAREALRLSLGEDNTEAEIDQVAAWIGEIVARLRSL